MSDSPADNSKRESNDHSQRPSKKKSSKHSSRRNSRSETRNRYDPYNYSYSTPGTGSGRNSRRASTTGSRRPSIHEQYKVTPRNFEGTQVGAHQGLVESQSRMSSSTSGPAISEETTGITGALGVEDLTIQLGDSTTRFTIEEPTSTAQSHPPRPLPPSFTAVNRFPGRENFSTEIPNEGLFGNIVHEFKLSEEEARSIKGYDDKQLGIYREARLDLEKEHLMKGQAPSPGSLEEDHIAAVANVSMADFDF